LSIPYGKGHITLQGIIPRAVDSCLIEIMQMSAESQDESVSAIPPLLQYILDQFQSVFATPAELPLRRTCDDKILLLPGATPVVARPYRYALALKDEIEKQVSEMLQAGIIRPSSRPFSSPALLVKKKDNT
jgi:hypothetical protein